MVGVKHDPFNRSDRLIIPLGQPFDGRYNDTQIVFDASVRMSRRIRHQNDEFYAILDSLEAQGEVHGRPLALTPLFGQGYDFDPSNGGCGGGTPCGGCSPPSADLPPTCTNRPDPRYAPATRKWNGYFCTTPQCLTHKAPYASLSNVAQDWGPTGFPGNAWSQLNLSVQLAIQQAQATCGDCSIEVVSLGDEVGITAPPNFANGSSFERWCTQHRIGLDELNCDATNWTSCTKPNTAADSAAQHPELFYHSMRFMNDAALAYYRNVTQAVRGLGLDGAKFGANFSPGYNYLGFAFVRLACCLDFRPCAVATEYPDKHHPISDVDQALPRAYDRPLRAAYLRTP